MLLVGHKLDVSREKLSGVYVIVFVLGGTLPCTGKKRVRDERRVYSVLFTLFPLRVYVPERKYFDKQKTSAAEKRARTVYYCFSSRFSNQYRGVPVNRP